MTVAIDNYHRFLARAAAGLASAGAQVLLPPDAGARAVPWAAGWDQILIADGPGSQTLYAFAEADNGSADDLQARIDRLVRGLAANGLLGRGTVPVGLVAIATFPEGLESRQVRRLTRLTPSHYYPGLRPATWVVDLAQGRVHTGGVIGRAEGKGILEGAAHPDGAARELDADSVDAMQRQHVERTNAFYRLMQGRQPLVTYGLVAVNVLVYLLLSLNGGPNSDAALREFGAMSPRLVEQGQWWRLFTEMFLHGSVAHILFNMLSLVAVGTLAERLYGSLKFLAIYLGAGLLGALTSVAVAVLMGNLDGYYVGASGAIFGVAGALVTVRFHPSDVIPQRLRNQVSSSMLPLTLLSLVLSPLLAANVDSAAHVGGLLGGMALSFVFPLTRRMPEAR